MISISDAARGSALGWLAMISEVAECATRAMGASVTATIETCTCGDLMTTFGVGISGAIKTEEAGQGKHHCDDRELPLHAHDSTQTLGGSDNIVLEWADVQYPKRWRSEI